MTMYHNSHLKNTAQKLIIGLKDDELKEVIDFIEFIKEKDKKIKKKEAQRISLQGFVTGSTVSDEDIEEAKRIWK